MAGVFVLLGLLLIAPALATAEPAERLSVTLVDGTVSLEAVNAPLDRVLRKIGEALDTRILIENVLADDLARARVDTSFTRVPPIVALRRVLRGRQYIVMYGASGVDELRIYVDGATGYRELTPSDPITKIRNSAAPVAPKPDDPAEINRLRKTALDGPDASARIEALEELSNMQDARPLLETLVQTLARERDSRVLLTVFELAAQQQDRIPAETLRTFARSDRDGTVRAQALELLADQTGADPATRALLRSFASNDVSAEVREAARAALEVLEGPPARPAEIGSPRARRNP